MTHAKTTLIIALGAHLILSSCAQARPRSDPRGAPPPRGRDAQERKILGVLQQLERGTWHANVSPTDGRLLYQLAASMGARRVVELGTSSGYSAIWFALALRKTGGRLYTHEIDPKMASMARANFRRAGVDKLITVIVGDAHKTVARHKAPIDIVFLDADKSGYLDYLTKLLPRVRPGGMIVAHNMRVPRPDPRFVKAITENPALDTMFVLMDGAGIALTLKKR